MEAKITLEQRLERLTQRSGGGAAPKLENLKKSEVIKKGKHGGRRDGSGRKTTEEAIIERGIKALIDEHVNGEIDVQVVDPKTGRLRIVKKPRVIVVLERLFQIGVKDGNVDALNKWLDRALGKPKQAITGGDEDDKPMLIMDMNTRADLDRLLEKAYGTEEEPSSPASPH